MHRTKVRLPEAALDAKQAELPSSLAYALQPIVDAHSGAVFAYEALLRGTDIAGYGSIETFFDTAHAEGRLWAVEQTLHQMALATFRRLPGGSDRKIFLNIDNRVFASADFTPETIADTANRLGVPPDRVVIELSEKYAGASIDLVARMRRAGLHIALDDFGRGFSELKLLHDASPEIVKVDRFYVDGVANAPRKRLFLTTIVELAHVLGARVVAEGVETEEEFRTCRDVGCDLIQGWYIARPLRDLTDVPSVYLLPSGGIAVNDDRVRTVSELGRFHEETVTLTTPIDQLYQRFADNPDLTAIPVIDDAGRPLGLITERSFRSAFYRSYASGASPLAVAELVTAVPTIDGARSCEELVERSVGCTDGVLVTSGDLYAGYVTPCGLTNLIAERRVRQARDQNPLSHLPGNATINAHIMWLCGQTAARRVCCYFDFNHFKPFNDTYGFRLGDRAIMLFADIMRRHFARFGGFLGHIGGDDFFASFLGADPADIEASVDNILDDFCHEIESLYEAADRDNGFLIADDRNGQSQIYPLMTCSAAVLQLPIGATIDTLDAFSRELASAKRVAKLAPDGRISRLIGKAATPH